MTIRAMTLGLFYGLFTLISATTASGQAFYPTHPPQGYAPAAPLMQQPYSMEGGYMNAHGEAITQACFQGGCASSSCSSYGCPSDCGGCDGPGGLLGKLGYGGGCGGPGCCGGYGEQCGPHYFDFAAEYLWYRRDDAVISDSMIISTFGFANDPDVINGTIPPNQIALTGADLSAEDDNHGFRLTGRLDVGALSVLEFGYSGVFSEDNTISVTNRGPVLTDQLFSVFSLYGSATNGDFGVGGSAGAPSGANFAETDDAQLHRISYESDLQTVEATYRRYWVGFNPRVSGTILVGFRYTELEEGMSFFSQSNDGTISIGSETANQLAGAQTGGDVWVCLCPGIRVGGEAKVGIYNNDYVMDNTTVINGTTTTIRSEEDQAAFLGEAKVSAVANVTPSISFRIGYEVLYMSDLAQMGDSLFSSMPYGDINDISANPPGGNIGPSMPATTKGEALFHGAHAGFDWTW